MQLSTTSPQSVCIGSRDISLLLGTVDRAEDSTSDWLSHLPGVTTELTQGAVLGMARLD